MSPPDTGSSARGETVVAAPSAGPRGETASTARTFDLCVIGAGSGGLSVAAAAAAFGEKVALIERHRMGGDCLNTGCVPSKALLAAARRAQAFRTSGPFGVRPVSPEIDHRAVHDHVRRVISAIAPNDSVERFTGLGVTVIEGTARFAGRDTVVVRQPAASPGAAVAEQTIKARRFVVATGSRPAVPPIPGLEKVQYFTNETIFDNAQRLEHLIVIGGGPIGLELALAHLRLGSRVTVLEAATALGRDDPELTAVVLAQLRTEGLVIRDHAVADRIEGRNGALRVIVRTGADAAADSDAVEGTHLLVATGRKPNIEDLDLAAAGIEADGRGIKVDRTLRTSNKRVFAIGDCNGGPQFTHVANYQAGIVIRRALFRLPAKVDSGQLPRVTFTEPELAQVGLTEAEARAAGHGINVLRWPYHENDRAQAELATAGFVKVVTDRRGRILGAGIVGEHAGELIGMWSLAIARKLDIKAMTGWISPYPTLGEINKRAAYRYYAGAASSPLVRKVIGWLKGFG